MALLLSIACGNQLWDFVRAPATEVLPKLGINSYLVINNPAEAFYIIWVKLPVVFALFLSSPWTLYQFWALIAPALNEKDGRLARPFILSTAGSFIMGGAFGYFVIFRYGLPFLLNMLLRGDGAFLSIKLYFNLFVNVVLGVALDCELPVFIFFLTLLHLASPRLLMQHSRYAVLAIVILAAVITPTPDFFNLMLFAVPMCMLFFVGVFASDLLVLKREGQKFPSTKTLLITLLLILLMGGIIHLVFLKVLHYHFVNHWPFYLK